MQRVPSQERQGGLPPTFATVSREELGLSTVPDVIRARDNLLRVVEVNLDVGFAPWRIARTRDAHVLPHYRRDRGFELRRWRWLQILLKEHPHMQILQDQRIAAWRV